MFVYLFLFCFVLSSVSFMMVRWDISGVAKRRAQKIILLKKQTNKQTCKKILMYYCVPFNVLDSHT